MDLTLLQMVSYLAGEVGRLEQELGKAQSQLENLRNELVIAGELQKALMPSDPPAINGLDICAEAFQVSGVGGDYYDYIGLKNGRLGIVIADTSGKGVPAALMAVCLHLLIRHELQDDRADLPALFLRLNRMILEMRRINKRLQIDKYVTLFYGEFNPLNGNLVFVNAGHVPPVVIRNGITGLSINPLGYGGIPLGMMASLPKPYEVGQWKLQAGDLLLAFTDGLTEASNREGQEWGVEGLSESAGRFYAQPTSRDVLRSVLESMAKFADGGSHDDTTLMAIRVTG